MKRSEMVLKLTKAYSIRHVMVEGRYITPQVFMDEILQYIEDLGMAPTGYMKPIPIESNGKQYPLVPGDFQNDKGIWCTPGVQEWEPENET